MCIPTKVAPTAGFLRANISMIGKSSTPKTSSQTQKLHYLRRFSTFKCGPAGKGEIKGSIGNSSNVAFCPVVTYCSILSIFTAIVYINMAHGVKKIRN